jgi:hypothetical protein
MPIIRFRDVAPVAALRTPFTGPESGIRPGPERSIRLAMADVETGWRPPAPGPEAGWYRPEAGKTWPFAEAGWYRPEAGRGWPFADPDPESGSDLRASARIDRRLVFVEKPSPEAGIRRPGGFRRLPREGRELVAA